MMNLLSKGPVGNNSNGDGTDFYFFFVSFEPK